MHINLKTAMPKPPKTMLKLLRTKVVQYNQQPIVPMLPSMIGTLWIIEMRVKPPKIAEVMHWIIWSTSIIVLMGLLGVYLVM